MGRCTPEGSSSRTASAPSSNASCRARDRVGDPVGGDHAGDLDRRGGDHLDVDLGLAEDPEDGRRDAGMAAHPGTDDRDLADLVVRVELGDVEPGQRLARPLEVVAGDGEREVRLRVLGDGLVLDDHVDVDVGVGEGAEHAPGDAGLVAEPGQRHPRLVGVGHGCHHRLLHRRVLGEHERTGGVLERAAAVDADPVVAPVLDRAQLQHPGARGRHLEHLVERDLGELARARARSAGRR